MAAEHLGIRALDRGGLIAAWAADRAAAVTRITDNGWGVDSNDVLRGPGGLTIDLSQCPAGWSDAGPVNEATVPVTWWVSDYHGPGFDSALAFLDWLGDDGLVAGKKIDFSVQAPYSVWDADYFENNTDEERQEHQEVNERDVAELAVNAMAVVGFGEYPGNTGFRDLLDDACLPSVGRRRASETERLIDTPWSAPGVNLQSAGMARFWAQFVVDEVPGQRIGVLTFDADWADSLIAPLLSLGPAAEVVVVRLDPELPALDTAVDELLPPLDTALDELLAADLDVIFAVVGGLCPQGAERLHKVGSDVQLIVSELWCSAPHMFETADGTVGGGMWVLRSNSYLAEEHIRATAIGRARLGNDEASRFSIGGRSISLPAWQAVQILQIAAELPGGLTRSNIVLASWSFEGRHPLQEGPITVTWPDDPTAVDLQRLFVFDTDQQRWTPTDTIVGGG